MICQRPECDNEATKRVVVQSPIMSAPAFYYECDQHAREWEDARVKRIGGMVDIQDIGPADPDHLSDYYYSAIYGKDL